METNFTDRLIERCRATRSHIAVELSPSVDRIPAFLKDRFESTGALLYAYCKGIIDAICDIVPAVVIPTYIYEAFGIGGLVGMDAVAKYAASKEMVVINDVCKGGTKDAVLGYVSAYSGLSEESFFADALTLSPYSDAEGIKEAAAYCTEQGKGLFINVRNTPSADRVHFENIKTADNDEPVYKSAADDSGAFGRNYVGKNGYGVIGMYVYPGDDAYELRKLNKWGIVLVRAQHVTDFSDDRLYRYFYGDDAEGSLLVVRDAVLFACNSTENGASVTGGEFYAEAARKASERISVKAESMIANV